MKLQYEWLIKNSNWQPDNSYTRNTITHAFDELIASNGSLTRSLMELGTEFSVKVLKQELSLPLHHEQVLLNRPLQKMGIIREVELQVDENVVVFARSILPLSLVKKTQTGLAKLGQKPLGHLLFKKGQMRVTKRQFSVIDYQGKRYYARRTPYQYMGSTILVSEYFLSNIKPILGKNQAL